MRLTTGKCRLTLGGIGLFTLFLLIGCATTQLRHTWVNPNIRNVRIQRIVAIALTRDPVRRRMMEASMVQQLRDQFPEVTATESSTLISDQDLRDEAKVRQQLERAGADAELVMRVANVRRSDLYVPGSTTYIPEYYRTFWGYYRYWVPIAYEPGYIERDRDVQVETELYAKPNGDLAYSALSGTLNPTSPSSLARDVTSVVAKDLREKGLVS
jgi:hypothetical protein